MGIGNWDGWYAGCVDREPFGGKASYERAAAWLEPCATVEDWGCGKGYFGEVFGIDRVVGVDGSASPFAAVVADLADYRSQTPGLLLRHVLEHDPAWPLILDNALSSFTDRMVLVMFIIPGDGPTTDLLWEDPPGVPNLRINRPELEGHLTEAGVQWTTATLPPPPRALFGGELMYFITRGVNGSAL